MFLVVISFPSAKTKTKNNMEIPHDLGAGGLHHDFIEIDFLAVSHRGE